MVTGGAHLQQTQTTHISLRSTEVLLYTINVLPLYLYVVDPNGTPQQQLRPQTEQQQSLEHKLTQTTSTHRQAPQTARMSRQLATLGGLTPATPDSIAGGTIEVVDRFRDSQALKVKVERVFLAQGRRCRLDKRVSGGPGKPIRCSGAIIADGVKGATGCQARVRAYTGRSTKEWNVTEAVLNHVQCTGQSGDKRKRPCRRSVEEEAANLVVRIDELRLRSLKTTLLSTSLLMVPL